MPLQNRVTPRSALIADPARGTLMGNRGCLHDGQRRIVRNHRGKRWIYCRLEVEGRRRRVMSPGQYTELFFLDEATALAAGHRPCAACIYDRFAAFRDVWAAVHGLAPTAVTAGVIDEALHRARLADGVRRVDDPSSLPSGAFVSSAADAVPVLIYGGSALEWSPAGYRAAPSPSGPVQLLTPEPTLRVLAAGFVPSVHPSAGTG